MPCSFLHVAEHHKNQRKKKSTTTKFRASSTSHFFTLNSARRHSLCIYFLYKVMSHISPLLKVFTLLRYLLCEHFHRIFCGIVVDYLFLLVLCYCAYVLYTFFPFISVFVSCTRAHRLFLQHITHQKHLLRARIIMYHLI